MKNIKITALIFVFVLLLNLLVPCVSFASDYVSISDTTLYCGYELTERFPISVSPSLTDLSGLYYDIYDPSIASVSMSRTQLSIYGTRVGQTVVNIYNYGDLLLTVNIVVIPVGNGLYSIESGLSSDEFLEPIHLNNSGILKKYAESHTER